MIDIVLALPIYKNPQWFINWSDNMIKSFKDQYGQHIWPDYSDAEDAMKESGVEMIGVNGEYNFILRFKSQDDFTKFVLKWS